MTIKAERFCIVDAFSTGAMLAPEFKKYGCECVHLQSKISISSDFSSTYNPRSFRDHLIYDGTKESLNKLMEYFQLFPVKAFIPGTESGVSFADELNSIFNLQGNSQQTLSLRRNKYLMQEALRKAGLNSIQQAKINNVEQALKWTKKHGVWPVVIKPLDSAGSDSVTFCFSHCDVQKACKLLLGNINKMGIVNNEILIQERLFGNQYFMNGVSVNGQHRFIEIWREDKLEVEGASLICDREELLPYHGKIQKELKSYNEKVLNALGIREGAHHNELIYTSRGPVLIESAARMQGAMLHEAVISAIQNSHVTSTVKSYLTPDYFLKSFSGGYTIEKNLFCVSLISKTKGIVHKNNCLKYFRELTSFYAMFHTPQEGEQIDVTIDLFTNPGIIYLLHTDKKQIELDYQQIRIWEKENKLFDYVCDNQGQDAGEKII